MSCVNKIILIGFLGADPTWVGSGEKTFVTLSLATSEPWKNKDGTYSQKTQWHKIVIFNERMAETIARQCKKGSKIYVEGKLLSREQISPKTRETTIIYEVVVDKIHGVAFPMIKDEFNNSSPAPSLMDEVKAKFSPIFQDEDDDDAPF